MSDGTSLKTRPNGLPGNAFLGSKLYSNEVRAQIEEALVQALHRRCTGCGVPTERTDACCHMTCSHCRAEFSWICGTEYRYCRANHPCLNGSIYLHTMPQLVDILNARGLECTDQNGSDLFLAPWLDRMWLYKCRGPTTSGFDLVCLKLGPAGAWN